MSKKTDNRDFFDLHGDVSSYHGISLQQMLNQGKLLRKMLDYEDFPEMSVSDLSDCVVKVLKNNLSLPSSDTNVKGVASGIFHSFSMLNHECVPSCETSFDQRAVNVKALREVAAGEEMSIRYTNGGSYLARREHLLKFGFLCCCEMCEGMQSGQASLRAVDYECVTNGLLLTPANFSRANEAVIFRGRNETLRLASLEILSKFRRGELKVSDCVKFSTSVSQMLPPHAVTFPSSGILPLTFDSELHPVLPSYLYACSCKDEYLKLIREATQRVEDAVKSPSSITINDLLNENDFLSQLPPSNGFLLALSLFFANSFAFQIDKLHEDPTALSQVERVSSIPSSFGKYSDVLEGMIHACVQCLLLRIAGDLSIYPGGVSRLNSIEQLVRLVDRFSLILTSESSAQLKAELIEVRHDVLHALRDLLSNQKMQESRQFKWVTSNLSGATL
eukprot:GDKJ01002520.1.p1 GENE.GDKJ01002520.1~~GDKJ01002520.1.p1  ORF type:complete len:476 (+),score=102.37 GDKJ01002520.1:90-1430(+)